MKVEVVVPFLEPAIEQHDDGNITMRGFLFWDKQILRLLYEWNKQGGSLTPNVRISLEEPNESNT